MSRRYAPDHKALVLKILVAYHYDVAAASQYTGVPERTLRDWHHEILAADRRERAASAAVSIPKRRL
jgi:hypothetical protein